MNIFEKATRLKLRYPSPKGGNGLTTEQLWDLPLTSAKGVSLDGVAIEIFQELQTMTTISFVDSLSNPHKLGLELQLKVVKSVIETRKAENLSKQQAQVEATKRQDLMELIARKKAGEQEQRSLADLEAELASMG